MVKTQKAVTDLGQFGYALTGYFYFSMPTTKHASNTSKEVICLLLLFQEFLCIALNVHNIFPSIFIRFFLNIS